MIELGRPKLLLVTRNMPPLMGGIEQLNWHMAEQLTRFADVRVIGPRGCAAYAPPRVDVHEVPLAPLPLFLICAAWTALRQARSWHPHWIVAGSGLAAPLAWLASRLSGAHAAVYAHGLDMAVRHFVYRLLWFPAIRGMDRVLVNSHATHLLAERVGVLSARIEKLFPGVEIPESLPGSDAVSAFRAAHDLGRRPVLLSVGRLTERKGLREFVQEVLPGIAAQRPDAVLVIIGDVAKQALYAKSQSVQSIRAAAKALGLEANLRFLGVITDRDALSVAYCAADVHVFPVREIIGDPEGFGMVSVEAAAHGLATVAYATGGVLDAVDDGCSGYLVPPGDAADYTQAVLRLLEAPLPMQAMRLHAEAFAWDRFGDRLRDMFMLSSQSNGTPACADRRSVGDA